MARNRPVARPNWRHADGHPYDEADYGFTRFVDEADLARRRAKDAPSRLRTLLRRLAHFHHEDGAETSHEPR